MLSSLDDAQVRYIMFQLLLNIVSKRTRSLWYHNKFDLCNLMYEYRIPYVIRQGRVFYSDAPVPVSELLEVYDERVMKFLRDVVSKRLYVQMRAADWLEIREYVAQGGTELRITSSDL